MGRSPWALVWVILEKNFLQTDFEGKKSYKEIPCSNGFLCQGKNSITKGLVKKILVQTKSSISPVKLSAPKQNQVRFRRRTFHEPNLIRIKADPNYYDRLN